MNNIKMTVTKRNGEIVNFEFKKIEDSIRKAMTETIIGIDEQLIEQIGCIMTTMYEGNCENKNVEEIQDDIEKILMSTNRKDLAKKYILYRENRNKIRKNNKRDEQLLTDEFISKYKHSPSPMNQLGSFVYYRTYSRWLENESRREYWWETVRRAVEYNCSLVPTSRQEAEKLYDNVFNLKQFLSGRTFWVGGTEVAKKYPCSNFNCAFTALDSLEAFEDLFYLLMVGTGVGVGVANKFIDKLPTVRNNVEVIFKSYTPLPKNDREDNTSLEFIDDLVKITIGDSKEGWVQSLGYYLKILSNNQYSKIKTIIFDFDNVRPKGERLKTFGGTASGHTSLQNMYEKIHRTICSTDGKLTSLDCLDIANIIGENVVVGGVRRTAESAIADSDDNLIINAKNELYKNVDGIWLEDKKISHRKMSNNSIVYKTKPERKKWKWHLEKMKMSGEPGFVNEEAAKKRRSDFEGLNPCFEVLLSEIGMCNLTTININSFVNSKNEIQLSELIDAMKMSVRACYRMTTIDLELHKWNVKQKQDRLLGCSITGWMDFINKTKISKEKQIELLKLMKQVAHTEAKRYSEAIGGNMPKLITTIKPEGTLSLLPEVSSGLHGSHSPCYIRRIRINSIDPLVKVCEELNYPVYPENGEEWETCNTKVVEFLVKSSKGKTKYDMSAIEQLENYKMFMDYYVDHNASITVHVRENEWEDVEQWVWDNWDSVVAVSFLSLNDSFYPLLPYEAITEEEYNKRVLNMKPFIPSLISKYEQKETEFDIGNEGCEGGFCPVR